MNLHGIIHAEFETLGVIEAWAKQQDFSVTFTNTYLNEELPAVDDIDVLVVMGGPQGVNELDEYPYLRDEIALIQAMLAADKPVLGMCLGAQLLAAAIGGGVTTSPEKEVGIFPVELTSAGVNDRLFEHFPSTFNAMHWHYDMVQLPEKATVLAQSEGCPVQVFKVGNAAYGFQCHMEATRDMMRGMVEHCPQDLSVSRFTQTAAEMLEQDYDTMNQRMFLLLDQWLEDVAVEV